MRETRRPLAVLWMVLCWSTVAAPSGAVPLDPGTFFLETEINGRRKQEFGLGAASFINDEGHTSRSSGAAWDGFAGAVTSGGASPAAGFFAEGTAQGVPIPSGGFQGDQGMVSAHARLIYFARIVELDSLPVAVPQDALPLILPVTVRVIAQAHAEAHGLGNVAQALGSALVGGFFAGRVSALDAPGCAICQNVGDHRLDRDFEFSFLAGQVIGVELDVVGLSFAVAGGDISLGTAAARALVDPVFSFNQEAFDEFARTKGFPTFGLTQFHAFEFSPGVTPPVPGPTSPVPEPSSVALIVAGVLVVAAYKRNRLLARSRAAASLRQRAESHARAVG